MTTFQYFLGASILAVIISNAFIIFEEGGKPDLKSLLFADFIVIGIAAAVLWALA